MTLSLTDWMQGYGVIRHRTETRDRLQNWMQNTHPEGTPERDAAVADLQAADRLCSAGMWLTVHMTYSNRVRLDGADLSDEDFKDSPQGHTGGALNVIPAYVGYLLANSLSRRTRGWLMGQGHCVAAIDAVNALIGNQEPEQAERYSLSDAGLSQLCQDFYSYAVGADGRPCVPQGSHVNPYTAGGVSEGGYLGFAELQYPHVPLPGQELFTLLSDGAFEEQRGSDWAPRWWRGEDTGLVLPCMVLNHRRIDQRSLIAQSGDSDWLTRHLQLNHFEPLVIDGADPAAYAWAILTMAERLQARYQAVRDGGEGYPVKLPYTIAEVTKGYGFTSAGTNAAHSLPLGKNVSEQQDLRDRFRRDARQLHVDEQTLREAVARFAEPQKQGRVPERDHFLRKPEPVAFELLALDTGAQDTRFKEGKETSAMAAVDAWFAQLIRANPQVRFRLGNPDEVQSNKMAETLALLKHRVTDPEPDMPEAVTGGVISALNEEAVASAALANKQGLSMVVSYEAFAAKMLGAMRQEVIFARHLKPSGRAAAWPSVPVLATSHTWENGKNEQSHQDPTVAEAWLAEMEDVAPVYFPFDANSAQACLRQVFATRGQIALAVIAKGAQAVHCDSRGAQQAISDGALVVREADRPDLQLLAIGGYQLQATLEACDRLRARGVNCSVVAITQPGRFRFARDELEAQVVHTPSAIERLIPSARRRVFVCHTRPEAMAGTLRTLDTGAADSRFLGYRNRGGTLDVFGMQFANQQTWAHIVAAAAQLQPEDTGQDLLDEPEWAAVRGEGDPACLKPAR